MTDPVITVYAKLVALLKGEPTLCGTGDGLVKPGNFFSYEAASPAYKQKLNKQAADFPELTLDEGNFTDTAYQKWPTFCTVGTQSGPAVAWKEQFTQIFTITIILQDIRISYGSQIRNAALLALRKAGPRLGLPQLVTSWGPVTSTATKESTDATGGALRRVIKINIPVNFLFDGQTIVT